jgi:hypothetical protein
MATIAHELHPILADGAHGTSPSPHVVKNSCNPALLPASVGRFQFAL